MLWLCVPSASSNSSLCCFVQPTGTTNTYTQEEPGKGTFDSKIAASLGVPKGPQLAQLAKGGNITLADGRNLGYADCLACLPCQQPAFEIF